MFVLIVFWKKQEGTFLGISLPVPYPVQKPSASIMSSMEHAPFSEGLIIITTKCVERLAFPIVIVGRAVIAGLVIIIVVITVIAHVLKLNVGY